MGFGVYPVSSLREAGKEIQSQETFESGSSYPCSHGAGDPPKVLAKHPPVVDHLGAKVPLNQGGGPFGEVNHLLGPNQIQIQSPQTRENDGP